MFPKRIIVGLRLLEKWDYAVSGNDNYLKINLFGKLWKVANVNHDFWKFRNYWNYNTLVTRYTNCEITFKVWMKEGEVREISSKIQTESVIFGGKINCEL